MQLVDGHGWRLVQLSHVDGAGVCHRLCRDRHWIGDYCDRDLPGQLSAHALAAEDFTVADVDCCVMVDPSSRLACLRPAEPVDGQAHLPLCGSCRHALAMMRGFPRLPDAHPRVAAVPGLNARWFSLGDEQDRRELSHQIRHPIANILGWAEILQDDDTLDPVHARRLHVIHQSAKDLQRLLDHVAFPHGNQPLGPALATP